MKIQRETLKPIDFGGITIRDYTANQDGNSSLAELTIPAGACHKRAWSKRSDKYYYIIEGNLSFIVDDRLVNLYTGDVCIIRQGIRFSYENKSGAVVKVLLVHTPSFELAEEVFEE